MPIEDGDSARPWRRCKTGLAPCPLQHRLASRRLLGHLSPRSRRGPPRGMVQDRLTWVDRGPTQWFRLSSTARSTAASTEATSRRAPDDASKACDRGSSSALTTRRRSCTAASARVSARAVRMRSRRATIPDSASSRCRPISARSIAVPGLVQALQGERRLVRRCPRAERVSEGAGTGNHRSRILPDRACVILV